MLHHVNGVTENVDRVAAFSLFSSILQSFRKTPPTSNTPLAYITTDPGKRAVFVGHLFQGESVVRTIFSLPPLTGSPGKACPS